MTAPPIVPPAAGKSSTGGDVLLDVEDVWLKLGQSQILQGVSLQVKDRVRPGEVTGQVVALLGP